MSWGVILFLYKLKPQVSFYAANECPFTEKKFVEVHIKIIWKLNKTKIKIDNKKQMDLQI